MERNPHKKVGILGGGQLARMMFEAGEKIGLEIHVLCGSYDEPAPKKMRRDRVMIGNPHDFDDVVLFAKDVDVVTIESEFYDGAMLERCEEASGTPFLPSPKTLKLLQDRLYQKQLLKTHKLPTASFSDLGMQNAVHKAYYDWYKKKCVFKKRTGGYDGRGTFVVKYERDLKNFLETLGREKLTADSCTVEAFVDFENEVAFQIARNARGETRVYPLVKTVQTNFQLDTLVGPVMNENIHGFVKLVENFLENINYVGIMAFECFEFDDGGLMVNELAPRVHNSAHYTIEAMATSQFEMHLLAITGMEMPLIHQHAKEWAMVNIIGGTAPEVIIPEEVPEGIHIHMYGKSNRERRKLGHMTLTGNSSKEALDTLVQFRKKIEV